MQLFGHFQTQFWTLKSNKTAIFVLTVNPPLTFCVFNSILKKQRKMLRNFMNEIESTLLYFSVCNTIHQYIEQIFSVIFLAAKRSKMVMNHEAFFSSFTYGKNPCSSTLLVEFITDWYKAYEIAHFYGVFNMLFIFNALKKSSLRRKNQAPLCARCIHKT